MRPVDVVKPILVWPRHIELPAVAFAGGTVCSSTADRVTGSQKGSEGVVSDVRLYRLGDRCRDIHWALSARSEKWMVKQREGPSQFSATINLEVDTFRNRSLTDLFEWGIRLAAGMAESLRHQQARLTFHCGDRTFTLITNTDRTQWLDHLARINLNDICQPNPLPSSRGDISFQVMAAGVADTPASSAVNEQERQAKSDHQLLVRYNFARSRSGGTLSATWVEDARRELATTWQSHFRTRVA